MKTLRFLALTSIFCLSSCSKSKDPDIQFLKTVAADKSQPDYIRKSVSFFGDFLQGETVSKKDYLRAEAELCATRNESTLRVLIAILRSLEKRLPERLPTEQHVDDLSKRLGDNNNLEYEITPAFILGYLGNLIPVITYYDKKSGDAEVNGFFIRFETKYGLTPAGKYWLEKFRMEWKHAMADRQGSDGKWYSGREKMGLERPWEE